MTRLNLSIDQNQRAFGDPSERRTLLTSALYLHYETALLVSLMDFSFFLLNSFMLISCSFNSFSVFGHYISARLQIFWRPYLWLVWSFTQMVSFLEFSISNPVFPPSPSFIFFYIRHPLNANATCFIFIVTNNRFTTRHRCPIPAQIHFLLFTHLFLFQSVFSRMPTHHPLASLLLCTNSSSNLSILSFTRSKWSKPKRKDALSLVSECEITTLCLKVNCYSLFYQSLTLKTTHAY